MTPVVFFALSLVGCIISLVVHRRPRLFYHVLSMSTTLAALGAYSYSFHTGSWPEAFLGFVLTILSVHILMSALRKEWP